MVIIEQNVVTLEKKDSIENIYKDLTTSNFHSTGSTYTIYYQLIFCPTAGILKQKYNQR